MSIAATVARGADRPADTIHGRVAAVARAHPDAIALRSGDCRLSYRELVRQAQAFSHRLVGLGVGPGDIVPLLLPRGIDIVVAALGILGSGAAYAALDLSWPADRLAQLVDSVDPPVVVVADDHAAGQHVAFQQAGLTGRRTVRVGGPAAEQVDDRVGEQVDQPATEHVGEPATERVGEPATERELLSWAQGDPTAVSTVFFTSGSTGLPKAVLSTHQATTRLFGPDGVLLAGPGTAMPCLAPLPWDGFSLELWGMLTTGGTSVLYHGDFFMPADLIELVSRQGVDQLWLTAGLFNVFVTEQVEAFTGLRRVLTGGERMSAPHARRFLQAHPTIELVNGYGPVETCVFASTHRVQLAELAGQDELPVGAPVADTSVRILDGDRQLCIGEIGEICIGGGGLARGYHGRAELTERSFPVLAGLPEPTRGFPSDTGTAEGQRLYRTGDLGLIDDAGLLHYRGRLDRQLKVAGHRVEPGEVEAVAVGCGAAQAVVLGIPAPTGISGLALFAVAGSPELDVARLRSALRTELPGYLMPRRIELVDRIPLTNNGKVDHQALSERLLAAR
ncbi:MAG: AMP-binding protein [Actinomycetota bacterium]|nr:AMP-binding protein [Actinomycetota bacterium]